jgi:hypothetical protein
MHELVERPIVCRVSDHEDALAVVCASDVVEEAPCALDDLPVALAARERLVHVQGALRRHSESWPPSQPVAIPRSLSVLVEWVS